MTFATIYPWVKLQDIVSETQYGTSQPANENGGRFPILRMNNITYDGAFALDDLKWIDLAERDFEKHTVRRGDLLFNRTNSRELVGKTAVWNRDDRYAFAGYLIRVRFDESRVFSGYVSAYLNCGHGKSLLFARAKPSINMANISATDLLRIEIPLPPLSAQKRIVAILDQADAILRKRRETVKIATQLTKAIFLEMFGDPATNPRDWPISRFGELLSDGLRNGESPATGGAIHGKVLTLNAITGLVFDPGAWKEAKFEHFREDSRISKSDFLICRGNGNQNLVGTAKSPTVDMPDVVFPDTMIAARVDTDHTDLLFLEAQWETQHVRRQILRGARTTNGTYKINQQVISSLQLIAPPMTAQAAFGERVTAVRNILRKEEEALSDAGSIFHSLVQRAFLGELGGST